MARLRFLAVCFVVLHFWKVEWSVWLGSAKYQFSPEIVAQNTAKNVTQNTVFLKYCSAKYSKKCYAKYSFLQKLLLKIQVQLSSLFAFYSNNKKMFRKIQDMNSSQITVFPQQCSALYSDEIQCSAFYNYFRFLLRKIQFRKLQFCCDFVAHFTVSAKYRKC